MVQVQMNFKKCMVLYNFNQLHKYIWTIFYWMLDLFQKNIFFYRMLDLFCTFSENGGYSAAELLEVVFTAKLSSSSFINSGKALIDIFAIRFRIRGSVELFI